MSDQPGAAAFDPELVSLLSAVRAQVDAWTVEDASNRRQAPRFNLFDFLPSNETSLSAIFAWLLDPRGSHGQGADLLRAFLETFGIPVPSGLDGAIVRTEARTHLIDESMRRIDVRVRIGEFVLGIENKPKAAWQPRQARAYLAQLAGESSRHCLAVVKSRRGDLPEDQLNEAERKAAVDGGRLVDGDYTMVVRWLEACEGVTPAAEVRMLLRHLAQKSKEFLGEDTQMRTDRDVTKALLADAALRRSAFDLLAAKSTMLGQLASKLRDDVEREVADALEPVVGRRVEPVGRYDPEGKWGGSNLSFDYDPASPITLMIGFHHVDLRGFYLGLETRGSVPADARTKALHGLVKDLFGREMSTTKAWVFWVDVAGFSASDPASGPAGWEAFADGSAAKLAGRWAASTVKALKEGGEFPWLPATPRS